MVQKSELKIKTLLESDYLAILGFIEKLNHCQSIKALESLLDTDLLPLLKAQSCVYGWVDPEFQNAGLMGSVNLPEHTGRIYSKILPYDPVGTYSLEKSRSVIAYDIDLPRSIIPDIVNKFLEDHPELNPEEHPYFFSIETMLAAFDLPTPSIGLGIHRLNSGAEAWTYREVRILELLRPHIFHSIKSIGIQMELEKQKSLNHALMDSPTPFAIFDQDHQNYFQNSAYKKWSKNGGEGEIIDQLKKIGTRSFPENSTPGDLLNETDPNLPLLARDDGVFHLDITRTSNVKGIDGHLWVVKICSPTGAYSQANLQMQKAGLSKREMEVCYLAKDGCKIGEIAERLFISSKTVETHLKKIYKKLDVHSRAQLVSRLAKVGWT